MTATVSHIHLQRALARSQRQKDAAQRYREIEGLTSSDAKQVNDAINMNNQLWDEWYRFMGKIALFFVGLAVVVGAFLSLVP